MGESLLVRILLKMSTQYQSINDLISSKQQLLKVLTILNQNTAIATSTPTTSTVTTATATTMTYSTEESTQIKTETVYKLIQFNYPKASHFAETQKLYQQLNSLSNNYKNSSFLMAMARFNFLVSKKYQQLKQVSQNQDTNDKNKSKSKNANQSDFFKQVDSTIGLFAVCVKNNKDKLKAIHMIGKCYLILNNDLNKGIEYFSLSLKANNNYVPSMICLIQIHLSLFKKNSNNQVDSKDKKKSIPTEQHNPLAEAEKYLLLAESIKDNSDILKYLKGKVKQANCNYQAAIELYNQVLNKQDLKIQLQKGIQTDLKYCQFKLDLLNTNQESISIN